MRISIGVRLYCLALAVALSVPLAVAAGKMTPGHLDAYQEIMKQIMQADGQLFEQMQYVSKRLQRFYAKYHRFPVPGVEEDAFKASVVSHFPFNPYHPKVTDLYYDRPLREEEKTHLFILTDPQLSFDHIREFRKAPPNSWRAEPGTIMVITNGEGTFAIWGASVDRQPVRNLSNNNRIRLIAHDLYAEEEQRRSIAVEGRTN